MQFKSKIDIKWDIFHLISIVEKLCSIRLGCLTFTMNLDFQNLLLSPIIRNMSLRIIVIAEGLLLNLRAKQDCQHKEDN